MPTIIAFAIHVCWACVIAYWGYTAGNAKPTQWTENLAKQLLCYWLPLLLAILLLGPAAWFEQHWLGRRLLPAVPAVPLLGLAGTAAGVALAIWSRTILGRNWSGNVTLKREHALITTGPYARLRHPIYSGFLLVFLGHAVAIGQVRGAVAVLVVLGSFLAKLRAEEGLMAAQFGQRYSAYRQRTRALIPGIY